MDELTEDAAQEIERVHARWIEFEVAGEHHSLMAMRRWHRVVAARLAACYWKWGGLGTDDARDDENSTY